MTSPIHDEDTALTLEPKLAEVGARLLIKALGLIREGRAIRKPQEESLVTFAHKLKKEDGRIDWPQPATVIRNRIRGFVPWPGCFCEVPDGRGACSESSGPAWSRSAACPEWSLNCPATARSWLAARTL